MAKRIPRKRSRKNETPMLFGASQYKTMGLGAFLIFIGFLIMAIDNQIEGFLSLYISPVIVMAGFIVFGYGIIKRTPVDEQQNQTESKSS